MLSLRISVLQPYASSLSRKEQYSNHSFSITNLSLSLSPIHFKKALSIQDGGSTSMYERAKTAERKNNSGDLCSEDRDV